MKYFLDTEFIEGFRKPLFSKRAHFIDLISIGIVAEDGRTYYAMSRNFNPREANEWVKKNVLRQMIDEFINSTSGELQDNIIRSFHGLTVEKATSLLQSYVGKTNADIAHDIVQFVNPHRYRLGGNTIYEKVGREHNVCTNRDHENYGWARPSFHGYYCDYDWVLFCSLFGTMMQLPKGFPMYMVDAKQTMDHYSISSEWKKANCPDPLKEHHALEDAKWIKLFHDRMEEYMKGIALANWK
jgi:hypothetical protein